MTQLEWLDPIVHIGAEPLPSAAVVILQLTASSVVFFTRSASLYHFCQGWLGLWLEGGILDPNVLESRHIMQEPEKLTYWICTVVETSL